MDTHQAEHASNSCVEFRELIASAYICSSRQELLTKAQISIMGIYIGSARADADRLRDFVCGFADHCMWFATASNFAKLAEQAARIAKSIAIHVQDLDVDGGPKPYWSLSGSSGGQLPRALPSGGLGERWVAEVVRRWTSNGPFGGRSWTNLGIASYCIVGPVEAGAGRRGCGRFLGFGRPARIGRNGPETALRRSARSGATGLSAERRRGPGVCEERSRAGEGGGVLRNWLASTGRPATVFTEDRQCRCTPQVHPHRPGSSWETLALAH